MNIAYVQKCEAKNTTPELSNKNQLSNHQDCDCTTKIFTEYYFKCLLGHKCVVFFYFFSMCFKIHVLTNYFRMADIKIAQNHNYSSIQITLTKLFASVSSMSSSLKKPPHYLIWWQQERLATVFQLSAVSNACLWLCMHLFPYIHTQAHKHSQSEL